MENVYWTMKDGQKINVDTMTVQHLRSTLKMIIKNQVRVNATKPKFQLHGDIAQDMQDLIEDPRDDWFH